MTDGAVDAGTEALRPECSDTSDSEGFAAAEAAHGDGSGDISDGPKERHECVVCGITTTSAAHLEVSLLLFLPLPQFSLNFLKIHLGPYTQVGCAQDKRFLSPATCWKG